MSQKNAERTLERLIERGYVNDESFARYWVENRNLTKGASRRKLIAELRAKGIEASVIEASLQDSSRTEADELAKVIAKKRSKYTDEQKLIAYLARQGFSYDEIKAGLAED